MFLLFRVITIGTNGVFVFLSYSAIMLIIYVLILFFLLGLTIWSFTFDLVSILIFTFLGIFSVAIFILDIYFDNNSSLFDNITLIRTMQYCFIWFVISEAALFFSFFWSAFSSSLFVTLEFHSMQLCIPLLYSYVLSNFGFVFHWVFLDLFSIVVNTFFLFFSGLFANYFLILTTCNYIYLAFIYGFISVLLGFLFIWNQMWEFALLHITISANTFCTTLFVIDIIHFSHVSLGVILLTFVTVKLLNYHNSNLNLVFVLCAVFYWHFVDLVWFILLRFLYFDVLCVLFLF